MEVIDDSFGSSTSKNQEKLVVVVEEEEEEEEEEEPGDLLDKSWFFGNLLDKKTRIISRCYSDPCPSSSLTDEEMLVGKSYEETYSSLKRLPQQDKFITSSPSGLVRSPSLPEASTHQANKGSKSRLQRSSNNLFRAPSLPTSVGREEIRTPSLPEASTHQANKGRLQRSSNNLFRAPSLPTSLGREEIQDEESDFSMSKLIRQASLNRSDMLPPRRVPKDVTQSSSTPRHRLRRNQNSEGIKTEGPEGMMIRRQHPISRTKLIKSKSDLVDELRGFKDLTIKFDNQDLGSIQDKKQQLVLNEDKVRKPCVSDPRLQPENSSSPMVKGSAEDMKAQIKFWARAVASNVRQEC